MDTMPCQTGRVFGKETEGVKGKLRHGNESIPGIGGEGNMHRCKGGDKVFFLPCEWIARRGWCGVGWDEKN